MAFIKKLWRGRSLARRLFFGFMVCAGLIWVSLVGWGVFTALTTGKLEAHHELDAYARQVHSVVSEFRDRPDALARAARVIEAIEEEPGPMDEEPDDFILQIWIDGMPLVSDQSPLSDAVPDYDGFRVIEMGEETYWTSVTHDQQTDTMVRIAYETGVQASISSEQLIFFFFPLLVSLPLLLIPAWFMTRYGLKPLNKIVHQIDERVQSGELRALEGSTYHELNPLVESTNSLMLRLEDQLRRERGFVADVAHEIKTPLAVMKSNVGRLKGVVAEPQQRVVEDLDAGLSRADHLIKQLLRMARIEQGADGLVSAHEFDLAEFLRQRIAQFEPLALERGITLEMNAPSTCDVILDADSVAAIFDNLIDNAIKYSPDRSRVDLSMKIDAGTSRVQVVIADQGNGIAAGDREAAFDRFKRLGEFDASLDTASERGGAGLGLSIVRRASARLGGQTELMSVPTGNGLQAVVTLPLRQAIGASENT